MNSIWLIQCQGPGGSGKLNNTANLMFLVTALLYNTYGISSGRFCTINFENSEFFDFFSVYRNSFCFLNLNCAALAILGSFNSGAHSQAVSQDLVTESPVLVERWAHGREPEGEPCTWIIHTSSSTRETDSFTPSPYTTISNSSNYITTAKASSSLTQGWVCLWSCCCSCTGFLAWLLTSASRGWTNHTLAR